MRRKDRPPFSVEREGERTIIQIHFPVPPRVRVSPRERVLEGFGDPVRVGDQVRVLDGSTRRTGGCLMPSLPQTARPPEPVVLLTYFGPLEKPTLCYVYRTAEGVRRTSCLYAGMRDGMTRKFELVEPRPAWWIDLAPGDRVILSRVANGHPKPVRDRKGQVGTVVGRSDYWKEPDKVIVQFDQGPEPRRAFLSGQYLDQLEEPPAEPPDGLTCIRGLR